MTLSARTYCTPLLIPGLLLIATTKLCMAETIDFEKQIRPLLIKRCGDCHGPTQQNSGLRLDTKQAAFQGGDGGQVIAPGRSDKSELFRRITSDDSDERMPPDEPPLPQAEIDLIRKWLDSGAPWPETDYDRQATRDKRLDHWAFQPLSAVVRKDTRQKSMSVRAKAAQLDQFIASRLKEQGLHPSPPADRTTLIRRLYFDMIGLPPAPEAVMRFVQDTNPSAFEVLVEELLHSPRYGERWAQHWLDVVRYADTHGFEVNTPRENAWPYRDYVIQAFNEDKPYDQFIREQLAGDAHQADAATGFLVAAAVLLPGQVGKDEESIRLARQDSLDEIIVGTSATFLGLTIGCARCHDHKFDPITARDYYALQAFFAGVRYGDRPIRDADYQKRLASAGRLGTRIKSLDARLEKFEAIAFTGTTLIIDEDSADHVSVLQTPNGPGTNPAGTARGYRDDAGAADRVGNISRGHYTWWNNVPGQDILTYNPKLAGKFHLWISWGAHGGGAHTRDARYVLDEDGQLTTTDDQHEVARVDQYYPAGVSEGRTEVTPLWSGLLYAGTVDLTTDSKLVVRGGETGTAITADAIVLQQAASSLNISTLQAAPTRTEPEQQTRPRLPNLREPVSPQRNTERFPATEAKFLRFTTLATIDDNKHQPCIDELEVYDATQPSVNIALAASGTMATSSGNYSETGRHQLKHINDGQYGNDRSWISNIYGGGWVQLEFPETVRIQRVVWGRDRTGKFKDRLSVEYSIETSLDGKNWTTVAHHSDRVPIGTPHDPVRTLLQNRVFESNDDPAALLEEIQQLKKQKSALETVQTVYGGQFVTPEDTFLLRRGDPEQPVTQVAPAVPALFEMAPLPSELSEQERRIQLAEWIASPDNPLTARVMVNRLWQYHFGRGLVDTASDFGLNGSRPSHPELLDWLATEFIQSGWSIKHIHRLILLSQTWQQSSVVDEDSAGIDRDNQWLWRFSSRRLEAEAIRDTMLTVTGELNLKAGGPGFNFFKTRGGLSGFPELDRFSAEEMRRMIYSHKIRMERVPVFGAFDCPDAGQATPTRTLSTTAIQALNLFNSSFVADRAEKLAQRIRDEVPESGPVQIERAFRLTLGRRPSQTEFAASESLVIDHGLETLCRVLFNSSEFLFIP